MKRSYLNLWCFLLTFLMSIRGFSQGKFVKLGIAMPNTSVGKLVGNGYCLSFGKETDKILNVRARLGLDLFYHKGSNESFSSFETYPGFGSGEILEAKTYSSTRFLNGQLVASLDYFLFDRLPNFYFGPDAFLSVGIHGYNENYYGVYTYGGGIKAHVGAEKSLGKKVKIFGEYTFSYVATTPYFYISPPSYSGEAEKTVWWFTTFHQFGLGFRF